MPTLNDFSNNNYYMTPSEWAASQWQGLTVPSWLPSESWRELPYPFPLEYSVISNPVATTSRLGTVGINNTLNTNTDTSGLKNYAYKVKPTAGQKINFMIKNNPAVGAAIQAAGQIGGSLASKAISDGLHSTAGDVVGTVGGIAGSVIGSYFGPLGSAAGNFLGQSLGGVTNRLVGYKTNDENIAKVKGNIAMQKAVGNQLQTVNDTSTLINAYGSVSPLHFSRGDLGRDGLLSHKIRNMERLFHNRQNYGTALMNHGLETGEKRADSMQEELTKKYNTISYADGGLLGYNTGMPAVDYDFMNGYLTMRNNQNLNKGKVISPIVFALGGDVQTHGADFSTGSRHINAGGTHEENPNEGVQMGVDRQGTPNLVEEGEVVYNDYVYSKRINLDNEAKEKFHISKKREISYADMAKKLEKEVSERPNDPISKAGYKAQMEALAEEQERQKAEMQAKEAQEMFAQLSPEEQVAVMQQLGGQQQPMQEEVPMEGEEVSPGGLVNQEGIMPQEGMMISPEMGIPMGNMGAYGGNLFALGGDTSKMSTDEMIRRINAVAKGGGSSDNIFGKIADYLGLAMDPISLSFVLIDRITKGKSTEAAGKAIDAFFNTPVGQKVADFIIQDYEMGNGTIQSGKRMRKARQFTNLKLLKRAYNTKKLKGNTPLIEAEPDPIPSTGAAPKNNAASSPKPENSSAGNKASTNNGPEVPSGNATAEAQARITRAEGNAARGKRQRTPEQEKAVRDRAERMSHKKATRRAVKASIWGGGALGLIGTGMALNNTHGVQSTFGYDPEGVSNSVLGDTMLTPPPIPSNTSNSSTTGNGKGFYYSMDGSVYGTMEEAKARTEELKKNSPELYNQLHESYLSLKALRDAGITMSHKDIANQLKTNYEALTGDVSSNTDNVSYNATDAAPAVPGNSGNYSYGNTDNNGYVPIVAAASPTDSSASNNGIQVAPPKPLSPYQTILNALGIHTEDDWNKWAEDNKVQGTLSEDNVNELLKDKNFIDALTKSSPILGHALSQGYDFGAYKPEIPKELTFDFQHGGWGSEDYSAWNGSTDDAWLEAMEKGLVKEGMTSEEIDKALKQTDAYNRGTKWLQDSEDNRLAYLQAILNSKDAPKAARDFAAKFVDANGWKKDAKKDYDSIFGTVRTTHPGTYWKTPKEVSRGQKTLNWVQDKDGNIKAVMGDPDKAWGNPINTYTWQDKDSDITYNYYKELVEEAAKKEDPEDKKKGVDYSKYDINHRNDYYLSPEVLGPAGALTAMMAGIGRPRKITGSYVAPVLTNYQPVGNYMKYSPMDIWAAQNANNARSLSTDRYIRNNTGPIGAQWAGLIANGNNGTNANGELFQKANLGNLQSMEAALKHNQGIDTYNATAHDRTAQYNASALNEFSKWNATMDLQRQIQNEENRVGWYNSLYGNFGALAKALGKAKRQQDQYNMIMDMAANDIFGDIDPESPLGRRVFRKRG